MVSEWLILMVIWLVTYAFRHTHIQKTKPTEARSPWKRCIYFIFNMRNDFCFSKPTEKVQLNWRYRWNELKHGFLPQITTKENLLVTSFKWIVLDEWHKYMFRDNNASHLQDRAAVYHWSGKSLGNLLIKEMFFCLLLFLIVLESDAVLH